MKKRLVFYPILIISLYLFYDLGRPIWTPIIQRILGRKTVSDVVKELGPMIRPKWEKIFKARGISYPPREITLIALKEEKKLEIWTDSENENFVLIESMPIMGQSGISGPKLKQGDMQVPEGIYPITGLNPNSSLHLSLKIGYPNQEDREESRKAGFKDPGSNIFIHGTKASVGCLALGNRGIERLFILVADTGASHVKIIIIPNDIRTVESPEKLKYEGDWIRKRYNRMKYSLRKFKRDQ